MKTRLLLAGSILAVFAVGLTIYFYVSRSSAGAVDARAHSTPVVDVADVRARAGKGEASAEVQLGRLYAKGEFVTNSYAEAAKWYEKAASQGDAEAKLALGELFEAGQGVHRDAAHALKLYREAAEQGNAGAQYTLGFIYEAGRGVPVDQVQAAQWFRRAAEGGEPLAQFDLGQRYELGVGVTADPVEAYKWFSLAAAQGQPDSATRLKKVRAGMTREQIAEAKRRVAEFSLPKRPAAAGSTEMRGNRYPSATLTLINRRLSKTSPALGSNSLFNTYQQSPGPIDEHGC